MPDLTIFGQGGVAFCLFWASVYAVLLAIYFGLGGALVLLNRRMAHRRIQERTRSSRVAAEIRQSVVALALISFYVAAGLYAQHLGWVLFAPQPLTVLSFVGWMLVSAVAYDTWFYWGHRAMHTRALFRFHALHHRSLTPTTWSNNSDSLVGATVEQGYFLILPLLLPVPPEVLIAHKLYDQITGMISHCGHEYAASRSARKPWPLLCTSFHDQHHSNFRCNFGNTFSIWDRLMGTVHPGYDTLVVDMEQRSATPFPAEPDRQQSSTLS
ncbi:sterol desaturase family protein [Breoghania sp. L-A4]|uniref:sterol desaturase family protein n=1 Tax=Breoghania sp. L-A4 TaxID=2304600 RepID=UPI000E358E34|nr:sterol desaturase family protein [Breoghania sp. L-A4]AXS41027.1 fatty acid hydroxylase family protein [Breoghania sp. L-A4]